MCKYLLFCFLLCFLYALSAHQSYGPFNILFIGAESCKGPKRRNCTDVEFKMNGSKMIYHVRVKEDVAPTKGKVVGMNNGKEVMTLHIKSLCSNVYLSWVVKKIYNANKDCIILKGEYNYTLDMQEIAQKYHQNASFIYGEWSFKSVFFNDQCNFDCVITNYKLTPKKKEI